MSSGRHRGEGGTLRDNRLMGLAALIVLAAAIAFGEALDGQPREAFMSERCIRYPTHRRHAPRSATFS